MNKTKLSISVDPATAMRVRALAATYYRRNVSALVEDAIERMIECINAGERIEKPWLEPMPKIKRNNKGASR